MTPRRKKDENGTSAGSNKNTEDELSSNQEGSSSYLAVMEEREKDNQRQQQNQQREVEDSTTIRIDGSEDSSEEETAASGGGTTTTSNAGASGSNLGRRGDPRMHKAVSARLANPAISLLEALVEGGFNFPNDVETCGKSDRDIYDSEGVQLCQRKNQLSRRLRLIRKREKTLKTDKSPNIADTIESIVGNSNSQNMINPQLALLGVQGAQQSNFKDMMLHQQQSQRLNDNLYRAMQTPGSTSHTSFPPEVGSHIPNFVLNNNNKRLQIEEDNAALLLLEQQSRAMKLLRTNNGNPAAHPSSGIPGNLRGGAAAGARSSIISDMYGASNALQSSAQGPFEFPYHLQGAAAQTAAGINHNSALNPGFPVGANIGNGINSTSNSAAASIAAAAAARRGASRSDADLDQAAKLQLSALTATKQQLLQQLAGVMNQQPGQQQPVCGNGPMNAAELSWNGVGHSPSLDFSGGVASAVPGDSRLPASNNGLLRGRRSPSSNGDLSAFENKLALAVNFYARDRQSFIISCLQKAGLNDPSILPVLIPTFEAKLASMGKHSAANTGD